MGVLNFLVKFFNTLKFFPQLTLKYYVSNVLSKAALVILLSQIFPIIYVYFVYGHTFVSWLSFMVVVETSLIASVYFVGVNAVERKQFRNMIAKKFGKFVKK